MKTFTTTVLSILISMTTFSQNKCDTLKSENEYLKKVLQIYADPGMAEYETSNNFKLKLLNVVGNKKNRTISLNFMITNLASRNDIYGFHFTGTKAIDLKGNEFAKFDLNIGKLGVSSSTLESNVPVKFWFTFYDIIEDIPYIRKAVIKYGSKEYIEFPNLKVDWK